MKQINLQSTEARGRNGWFRASTASVAEVQGVVYLGICSKRMGKGSPISLNLSLGDARRLKELLGSVLEDVAKSSAPNA